MQNISQSDSNNVFAKNDSDSIQKRSSFKSFVKSKLSISKNYIFSATLMLLSIRYVVRYTLVGFASLIYLFYLLKTGAFYKMKFGDLAMISLYCFFLYNFFRASLFSLIPGIVTTLIGAYYYFIGNIHSLHFKLDDSHALSVMHTGYFFMLVCVGFFIYSVTIMKNEEDY